MELGDSGSLTLTPVNSKPMVRQVVKLHNEGYETPLYVPKMNSNHVVPFFVCHRSESFVPKDTSIRDQDIEAAKPLDGLGDSLLDLLGIRDIDNEERQRATPEATREDASTFVQVPTTPRTSTPVPHDHAAGSAGRSTSRAATPIPRALDAVRPQATRAPSPIAETPLLETPSIPPSSPDGSHVSANTFGNQRD